MKKNASGRPIMFFFLSPKIDWCGPPCIINFISRFKVGITFTFYLIFRFHAGLFSPRLSSVHEGKGWCVWLDI